MAATTTTSSSSLSAATTSRSLFWEEETPGRTQLQAKITGSSANAQSGVTFYEIQVKVTSGEEQPENSAPDLRIWTVKRRYREFAALHRALGDLGFPCPQLPPRQLWGGHTWSFMNSRQQALNCWIQGVVIIWQSAAPNRGPSVAYAIGEMLEGFLCSEDSESFEKILEEVQVGSSSSSDAMIGGGGALASERDDYLSPTMPPARRASLQVPSTGVEMHQSRQPRPSFAQVAQEKRRSKVRSVDDFSRLMIVSSSPFVLKDNLQQQQQQQQQLTSSASAVSLRQVELSSSNRPPSSPIAGVAATAAAMAAAAAASPLPPLHEQQQQQQQQQQPMPMLPSNLIGFAVAPTPSSSSSSAATSSIAGDGRQQYETYNDKGEKVMREFHPFIQRVEFPIARASSTSTTTNNNNSTGLGGAFTGLGSPGFPDALKNACTPVSVPPTPFGQNQFNAQWSHYTSSVLEFVQERLSIVQRANGENFNILDRHSLRSARPSLDDDDEEEEAAARGSSSNNTASSQHKQQQQQQQQAVDLTSPDRPRYSLAAGGEHNARLQLVASYVRAGEHLIHTILREAQADITDWQFVSNTKDVIVMRRLRPIKKRNLLQQQNAVMTTPPSSSTAAAARNDDAASGSGNGVPSPPFETSQHCFMGRGLVDAPAAAIFDLVRRPDKRHFYDSMLNEELVLENWAVSGGGGGGGGGGDEDETTSAAQLERSNIGNLLVYYHLFETNRCFLRYVRDFCVVQYAKKVVQRGSGNSQSVKYVVVGASINHANCPLREGVERATLDLFGWVVEPTQKPNQSKVSYMMHIDFGKSGVPTHLLNTISFRQPLAVHYLRRHIKSLAAEGGGEGGGAAAAAAASTGAAGAVPASSAAATDEAAHKKKEG